MAAVDPRYGNSSGYFKDPVSGEDLSTETPRVVPCSFENGKFTWPMVMCSNGEQLLKIVYKYFTEEEKALYKQYRGRGRGNSSNTSNTSSSRSPSGKKPKESRAKQEFEVSQDDIDSGVYIPAGTGTASAETLDLIRRCDQFFGIAFISGIAYALLSAYMDHEVHYIPKSVIPDSEFRRIVGDKYVCE